MKLSGMDVISNENRQPGLLLSVELWIELKTNERLLGNENQEDNQKSLINKRKEWENFESLSEGNSLESGQKT